MADGTTEPKKGEGGSWWTTLPGVVTAFAALLTAVGGLIGALHEAGILPWAHPPDAQQTRLNAELTPPPQIDPSVTPTHVGASLGPVQVEGVEVKVVSVHRIGEKDGTFLQLNYSITNGPEWHRHDPAHFVQLVSDGATVAPVLTSTSAQDLPLNGTAEFSVKFRSPPGAARSVTFRFGEERHVSITKEISD
jgi:hypothetical protein